MSFFKNEKTEVELLQEEIDNNARIASDGKYILDVEDFVEVKIGEQHASESNNSAELPVERDDNVSNR